MVSLTWDNITSVHSVLVFNEAEAIHKLDFVDGTGCIFEVVLNVLLSDYGSEIDGQRNPLGDCDGLAGITGPIQRSLLHNMQNPKQRPDPVKLHCKAA